MRSQFPSFEGLLKEDSVGDKKAYRLTDRGGAFLEALKTIKKFIG
ncbi:MAG: hypothetical protein QXF31_04610 [Candidatus Bathyarchaeia archaeon]